MVQGGGRGWGRLGGGLALVLSLAAGRPAAPGSAPPAAPEGPVRAATAELEVSLAAAALPALGLALEGAALQGRGPFDPARGLPSGSFRIARVVDRQSPPRLPALQLEGAFEPAAAEGELAFRARASAAGGRAVVRAEGSHRVATGSGRARVVLEPLVFGPDALAARDLVPGVGDLVRAVRGRAGFHGVALWGEGPPRAGGILSLEALDFETPVVQVKGLSGRLRLDELWPPRIPPGQRLTMASLDVGLRLGAGAVVFGLGPGRVLDLERASWGFAGGQVSTAGRLDLDAPEQALSVAVEDASLAELLALVRLEQVHGEGRLSGRLPLVRREGRLAIRAGRLAATGPGWIRWDAAAAGIGPGVPGGAVLAAALRNFHYETLALGIEGDLAGELHVEIHLGGANPDYQEGQPVELNVNVDAGIADLVHSAGITARLSEVIERALRRHGAGTP